MPPPRARSSVDTAAARSRTCAAAIAGRGALRRRRPRALRADGSNYRQVPIGVVIPRTIDDVVAAVGARREHGAPILVPRRRDEPGRPGCNVAVVIDCSKYLNRDPRDRPRAAARARRAGRRPRRAARTRPTSARPDLRPRPVDARPLHARRHDRQQLLRRPLGDGAFYGPGPRTSDNVAELEVLTYDGERLPGRAPSGDGARPERAAPTRLRGARATATATRSASATRRSRAASPATTSTSCCPRTASTSPARWSAPRAPASPSSRRPSTWSTARPAASLVVAGYDDVYAAADHVPERARAQAASASRASTSMLVEDMTTHGLHRHDLSHAARRARLAAGRVRRRDARRRPTRRGARSSRALEQAGGGLRGHEALRRPGRARSTSGRCARPASARPRSSRASPTPARAGRTPPSARAARRLPARAPAAVRRATATRARSTATSARAASTPR